MVTGNILELIPDDYDVKDNRNTAVHELNGINDYIFNEDHVDNVQTDCRDKSLTMK